MPMKPVPTYIDGKGNTVTFARLGEGYPGFTHRVIINRVSVGLLSQKFKPNAKAAEYFLKEHGAKAGVQTPADCVG